MWLKKKAFSQSPLCGVGRTPYIIMFSNLELKSIRTNVPQLYNLTILHPSITYLCLGTREIHRLMVHQHQLWAGPYLKYTRTTDLV